MPPALCLHSSTAGNVLAATPAVAATPMLNAGHAYCMCMFACMCVYVCVWVCGVNSYNVPFRRLMVVYCIWRLIPGLPTVRSCVCVCVCVCVLCMAVVRVHVCMQTVCVTV